MALEPIDLVPQHQFWRDGCREMAKNICKVLRIAGEPITLENILEFASALPRDPDYLRSILWKSSFCSRCLQKVYDRIPEGRKICPESVLIDYFLGWFTMRNGNTQWMLTDSFVGILQGIELEG